LYTNEDVIPSGTNPPRLRHDHATLVFYTEYVNSRFSLRKEVEMSANTPVANKWTRRFPFAVIVVAIVVFVSYLVITPLPAIHLGVPIFENGLSIQRGLEADTARYTAMAEFYVAQAKHSQSGLEADAARYTAMAEFYNANEASIQRGLEADTARYTAMAKYYTEKEAARIQRSLNADTARYTAMAEYYMKK
jgi:hypothetical protein